VFAIQTKKQIKHLKIQKGLGHRKEYNLQYLHAVLVRMAAMFFVNTKN